MPSESISAYIRNVVRGVRSSWVTVETNAARRSDSSRDQRSTANTATIAASTPAQPRASEGSSEPARSTTTSDGPGTRRTGSVARKFSRSAGPSSVTRSSWAWGRGSAISASKLIAQHRPVHPRPVDRLAVVHGDAAQQQELVADPQRPHGAGRTRDEGEPVVDTAAPFGQRQGVGHRRAVALEVVVDRLHPTRELLGVDLALLRLAIRALDRDLGSGPSAFTDGAIVLIGDQRAGAVDGVVEHDLVGVALGLGQRVAQADPRDQRGHLGGVLGLRLAHEPDGVVGGDHEARVEVRRSRRHELLGLGLAEQPEDRNLLHQQWRGLAVEAPQREADLLLVRPADVGIDALFLESDELGGDERHHGDDHEQRRSEHEPRGPGLHGGSPSL